MKSLYQAIQKPITTEKSTIGNKEGKYIFIVHTKANKVEIKKAIEEIYQVKVSKVNIIPIPPKERVAGRKRQTITKRAAQKKAIVTLKKGETIDTNKVKDKK